MTATPEQAEIQFPDRIFYAAQYISPAENPDHNDLVQQRLDEDVLIEAWTAGFYAYDILHTKRVAPGGWGFTLSSEALTKKRS